jgi:hypothetical protein
MTTGRPDQPAGGFEYPDGATPPVNYPGDPMLLPPPGYYPAYPAYDPYRPVRPPGTNGKAIASMVCSAVGLTCCGLTSIVGVILGVIAMRETRRRGQDGYGLALAATIIGGLAVLGWAVYLLLYVALLASGWQWI